MSTITHPRNLLLEQAVEAVIPVLGAYAGGAVDSQPDVEGAIDRATTRFADRITIRWHDWLKARAPTEILHLLTNLVDLSPEDARREAAHVLDRHLLDVRPEDRSFALDYVAGIPSQVKQVLVFDRTAKTYALPPDWSILSPDALVRFLPLAGDLKADWAKAGAKESDTPMLQTKPDAPRTVLPALTTAPPPANVVEAARSLRRPDVLPKLWLLQRCHTLARRDWWVGFLVTCLLLVPVFVGLGILTGFGVFWGVYDDPNWHTKVYETHDQFGRLVEKKFTRRGVEVSQQQYDYYRATGSNEVQATIGAVSSGIAVSVALFIGWLVIINRWPSSPQRALQEQIQAIHESHPEEVRAWGGPAVLRQRGVVEELLRLEEKGGP
jgi:hypothetical protein